MIVSFHIEYRTNWGEEVCLIGSIPELGDNDVAQAIPLSTVDGIHWSIEKAIPVTNELTLTYSYLILKNKKLVRKEWSSLPRELHLHGGSNTSYRIYDCWKNLPEQHYLYSAAFTNSLLVRPHKDTYLHDKGCKKSLMIKAYEPQIGKDYCLAICGNQEALGNWNADKALQMCCPNFPEWIAEIDASKLTFPLEYKFILYNSKEKRAEAWENNPNRYLADPEIKTDETYVLSDRYVYFDTPAWKGAGVAIPVFSLKSEHSYGVGDFGDLKKMIDWAVSTNQKVVQILPINDTTMTHTWTDSYPYNSISIYALHPMYADLAQMGSLKDKKLAAQFHKKQKELNNLAVVDYEAVNKLKWDFFQKIFDQEGKQVLASEEFLAFFESNKEWLQPYAAFSYLRDIYQTPNFREWPLYTSYNEKEIEKLCNPKSSNYWKIAIYLYLQFNLHLQLLKATTYARTHGVVLKGDIPIGISRNSVEAWTEPHYFNLNGQAGAPPDNFSANGQNWGFPTYNWEVMEKDSYAWWMKRFKKMSEYFDAYRIDHILGFFRIWEIPSNAVHGLLGQFVPALPMSKQEIESYGLSFREEYILPYIHECILEQIFGKHKEFVKNTFVEPTEVCERYRMRPNFDTQRKVEAFFTDKTDEDSNWIKEGLYTLISNVLFVTDHQDNSKFHPRIGVQNDFVYQSLSEWDKSIFNTLYDHYYYHRHNDFWSQQALKKLPQLTESTRMLVCGEDLGMIPDCVAWVMNDLRILSLEIQRMPKNPAHEFGNLNEYPYRSVCTISTHDMSTLRGWWEENQEQTQRYYNFILGHQGKAPSAISASLCEEIVRKHLCSNSMFCILALQDWLSIDEKNRVSDVQRERINIPANSKHYWQYRMHITIEELLRNDELTNRIKLLINETGRNISK